MHIAICDDNVADRKQTERLLGRESDARKLQTGVFYTDSYGVGSQLLSKRMSYDLFFIDLVDDLNDGLDFSLDLCAQGVSAPIVLCSSKIDYELKAKDNIDLPSNILFLKKPIIKAELSNILDEAILIEKSKVKMIELRDKTDTHYVKEDELVYVEVKGRYIIAHLQNQNEVSMLDSLDNFASSLREFSHFAVISDRALINITYIENISPFKVCLKDGTVLKSALSLYGKIKDIYNSYKENI